MDHIPRLIFTRRSVRLLRFGALLIWSAFMFIWGSGIAQAALRSGSVYAGPSTGPTNDPPFMYLGSLCNTLTGGYAASGAFYLPNNSYTTNFALVDAYGQHDVRCEVSQGVFQRFVGADFYLYPTCEPGIVETADWETTVGAGSTSLSFIPAETAPTSLCSSWCRLLTNELTYRAWIEPGHPEVGAKLWVELRGQLSGSTCNPADTASGEPAAPRPSYVCPTNDIDCSTGSGGTGGSGGGLDSTDKANLAGTAASSAAVATNTGSSGVLAERLGEIRDQGKAEIGDATSIGDCSKVFTCNGDAYRCAQLSYARHQYCESLDSKAAPVQQTNTEGQALFDVMKAETSASRWAALSKGNIDVSTAMNRPRIVTPTGCPAPEEVTLNLGSWSKTLQFKFDGFCQLADTLSFLLIFSSSIIGLRVFIGGIGA